MTEPRGSVCAGEMILQRLKRRPHHVGVLALSSHRPIEAKAPERASLDEPVRHLQQHAEIVAGPATNGPEKITVEPFTGDDQGTIGEHKKSFIDAVAIHAVQHRGETEAAPLRVAGDRHIIATSARDVQPVGIESCIDEAERRSGSDRGALPLGIDNHEVHAAEIDNDVVVHRVAGRAVAARAADRGKLAAPSKFQSRCDIAGHFAIDNDLRKGLVVDHEALSGQVVVGVVDEDDVTLERSFELIHGLLIEVWLHRRKMWRGRRCALSNSRPSSLPHSRSPQCRSVGVCVHTLICP